MFYYLTLSAYFLSSIICYKIPDLSTYKPANLSVNAIYTNQIVTLYDMQPGISVRKELSEYCKSISADTCEMLIDSFNYLYFGYYVVPYKDTQPYNDIFIQRSDVILYLREAFNYQSYLEIGCYTNMTFSFVKDIFNIAIGVDPSQGLV